MKVTLDQTYIYEGAFYGPGEADVPDAMAENLGMKKQGRAAKPAKPAVENPPAENPPAED